MTTRSYALPTGPVNTKELAQLVRADRGWGSLPYVEVNSTATSIMHDLLSASDDAAISAVIASYVANPAFAPTIKDASDLGQTHMHPPRPLPVVFTVIDQDLGALPISTGSFTITGAGLTTGRPVLIFQVPTAVTTIVLATAVVTNATTITVYWTAIAAVSGVVRFAYAVGG